MEVQKPRVETADRKLAMAGQSFAAPLTPSAKSENW